MTAILSGIVAFMEAVPIIDKWFQVLVSTYYKVKVSKIENLRIGEIEQRQAIINSIQKAETDAERIALSITLHKFNSGELPN